MVSPVGFLSVGVACRWRCWREAQPLAGPDQVGVGADDRAVRAVGAGDQAGDVLLGGASVRSARARAARGSHRAGPRPAAAARRASTRSAWPGRAARARLRVPAAERSRRGGHRARHDRTAAGQHDAETGQQRPPSRGRAAQAGGEREPSGRERPRRRPPRRSATAQAAPMARAQVAPVTSRSPNDIPRSLRLLVFASDNAQNHRVSNVCPQTVWAGPCRGMQKVMSWEESMFAVFDDLEQQAQGLHLAERDAEVADLTVAEYSRVSLACPAARLRRPGPAGAAARRPGRRRPAGATGGGLVPAGRRLLRVGGASSTASPRSAGSRRGATARTPGRWSTG